MPQPTSGALAGYGLSDAVLAAYQPFVRPDRELVRVARVDRGAVAVATARGLATARIPPGNGLAPATGDWAAARLAPDGSLLLEAVLPRTTAIRRTSRDGTTEQVLVANVETMLVLHGLDRPHRVGRLERLCILTWDAGAEPVIVLTKTDLLDTGGAAIELVDALDRIGRVLRDVEVLPVSSATGAGIGQLAPYLGPGATVGLVGESGAGKSTLVNRLAGEEVQRTGGVRRGDRKGRHTTTSRELIPLPSGAVLVDTPGLRMVAMAGGSDGLARAYDDLEKLFAECRFRDCAHRAEPGCAVRAALADGRLSDSRWAGYRKLAREIAYEERRSAERSRRAEEKRVGKKLRKVRQDREEW